MCIHITPIIQYIHLLAGIVIGEGGFVVAHTGGVGGDGHVGVGHVGVGHVNKGHDGHAGHTGRKFCNPIRLANAPNILPVARLESTDKENTSTIKLALKCLCR